MSGGRCVELGVRLQRVDWQVFGDPLGELLIELSSTPTTTRWSTERRRGAAGPGATSATQRPRAASCSRGRLLADAAAQLPSKSQSHTHLHRQPSNCSDLVDTGGSVQLRRRSSRQQQPVRLPNTLSFNIAFI